MIIPIYKPTGSSSHLLAQKVGMLTGEKATHTGTLDPLADGVLTVLTGEDRFKKQELASVKKQYSTTIVAGFNTDTHDFLGLITKNVLQEPRPEATSQLSAQIKSYLQNHPKDFEQQVPNFSAARSAGSSFFELAKSDQPLPVKKQAVTLFEATMLDSYHINATKLHNQVISTINLVAGDFRQEEVLRQWDRVLKNSSMQLSCFDLKLVCSKRFYVRSFIRDLSTHINIPLITLTITRDKNGPYSISDCTCLI